MLLKMFSLKSFQVSLLLIALTMTSSCSTSYLSKVEADREIASVEDESCSILIRKIILADGKQIDRKFGANKISYTSYRYTFLKKA